MTAVLHLGGPVLVGPDEVVPEAWVVGGRITFERPAGETTALPGWVVPGLVDAHCHVGIASGGGHVEDLGVARDQALVEIWSKTADLAVSVAGRVLSRELNEADHRRLVESAIGELPAAPGANGHGGRS